MLATNGYTDDLWPDLRQSVIPVFSAIAATEPLPAELARPILRERSVLYEVGFNTVYYRLDAQDRLLMGGRSPLRSISGPGEAGFLRRYALKLWPGLKATAWTHAWNGRVAVTADHYPHFHEPADNVHVSLGYNGRGIAMSTVMGDVLARRILGAPEAELPMPITALHPIRFHGLWRPAAACRLIYGRVRDALGI